MLEKILENIDVNLGRIADALDQLAGFNVAGETAATDEEPESETETPASKRKPASKSQTLGKITQEQVHEKLTAITEKLGKGPGRDAVLKILREQGDGAKGMKSLDASHYKAVLDAAQDLLDD